MSTLAEINRRAGRASIKIGPGGAAPRAIQASQSDTWPLLRAVHGVLDLHRPVRSVFGVMECQVCIDKADYMPNLYEWPCPTVQAIIAAGIEVEG